MTTIYYYVLPMLLGRTYDIMTDSPGVDIFPQDAIENATVIERHVTDSQYRMVSDAQEARDFLGVSGDLSLKLKSGQVQMEGLGNYMKDSNSRSRSVEILVKVHYETETLTLPSTASPRLNWRDLDRRNIGSHYVRSMTYGGDLVASLRFTAKNSADRESIRAAVQANLQAGSGAFGLGVEGNFSRLQEDLKDSSTLEINYYATVPLRGVPNTMESLMELVESFPEQTELVNGGKGVPLSMELFPLSALDADLPRYLESKALVDQLDLLESQFDDLRATKRALQEWFLNVPPILDQELEEEVGELNDELERISLVFYRVLGNMNLQEGAGTEQFAPAFEAYAGGGTGLPDKYYRRFVVLRHKIVSTTSSLTLDVGGAVYTRWGGGRCEESEGADTLHMGVAASTDQVKGGTGNIICVTEDPEYLPDTRQYKRHHRFSSKLTPVRVHGRNLTSDQTLECALCFVEERTAPTVFPGRTTCPAEWTLEYEGVMSTKDSRGRKGDILCLSKRSQGHPGDVLRIFKTERSEFLSDMRVTCGTLPCDSYPNDATVPCVVCSY